MIEIWPSWFGKITICRIRWGDFSEEVPKAIHDAVPELLGVRITGWHQVEHTTTTVLRFARVRGCDLCRERGQLHHGKPKIRVTPPPDGAFSKRVRQIEEHHRLGTQEAVELISTTDDMRRRYVKHYYRAEIDDPINYHFVDQHRLVGYQEAARIIADATMNIQSLVPKKKRCKTSLGFGTLADWKPSCRLFGV